jgi:UDP-4-amino-4,6-dideoxy-N-acetyl-beta-L-altrosamine N-acetyltransferase
MLRRDQCQLRTMAEADLPLVLKWRNSDFVRNYMYTDHIITPEEHRAWFSRARKDENARHLVFEADGQPTGVVNVTNLDAANGTCHWGFYVGRPDAARGTGTRMGILALEYIFDHLHVRKCIGEVLAFNDASLRYHKRLGFTEEGILKARVAKRGRLEDVVVVGHFADRWLSTKDALYQQYFACEVGV